MADRVEAPQPVRQAGIWDRVLTYLQAQSAAVGELDWTVSVDSTVARLHQRGATANRSRAARRTQAYSARAYRDQLRACQVTVVTPERSDEIRNRHNKGSGQATRYDEPVLNYRSGMVLASVMLWLEPFGDHP